MASFTGSKSPRLQSMSSAERSLPLYQAATLLRPLSPRVEAPQPKCCTSDGTVANALLPVLISHIETRTVSQAKSSLMCASCHRRNSPINSLGHTSAGPDAPSFSIHDSPRARARQTECAFVQSATMLSGRATLVARDGAVTTQLAWQIDQLPPDASHLILSVGGNDALDHSSLILHESAGSFAEVLSRLSEIQTQFRRDYRAALEQTSADRVDWHRRL